MAMTRRTFVSASVLAALGAVAGRALGRADAATAAAAPVLRPGSVGTTASRCSRCGREGHSSLDVRCSEGAEARQAVRASARRLAARAKGSSGPRAGRRAGS